MRRHGSDPYVPNHGDDSYRVEHYDLNLAYKVAGNRLDAEATLSCRAGEAAIGALELDLHTLRVVKLWVDGAVAKWTHRGDRVRVQLPRPIGAGMPFTVRVRYSGSPTLVRSRRLGTAGWEELTDGVIVASQPHGAPSWFPCNDRPDNKTTYRIAVSVPVGYRVAASGELVECRRSGASREWIFEQGVPMATYLATVQIGRYQLIEQDSPRVPVRVLAPRRLAPGFAAAFGAQPQMLTFFESVFGPYPFASYTAVITDDPLEIPLESQGLSTFGRNFMTNTWDSIRLVAHELAHQWFGNAVTLGRWSDIWLHEGFACYAEWLWSEHAGVQSANERAAHHYARMVATQGPELVLSEPGPALMFDDRVYKRGALTLHALRAEVGDEVFFDILRSWVAEHRGGNVSTEQFVAHCAARAGRDLSSLFTQWLDQVPLPPLPQV
ncbi:M1 family peptidase [Epidermidibacterium keratini]|uniref:Aminopeptidase N n=1 Tax=Epidermidibacterium keratini TaxID=1891644 RepID=A0A7L4YLP9_9ACTN|nr:M1 family metallopeptidase [Epidermidibacterium keratini]QHB99997.1 M1 family peptidase [Epidermidibacterium keratini]